MQRRNFLFGLFSLAILTPLHALAAVWNKAAFESEKLSDASKNLNISNEIVSSEIQIIAPDRAENGAIVQVEIKSNIENTESITLLVEHNPTPLIAQFKFGYGAEAFVITRIKMAETSDVKVIVKAGNRYYANSKNVIVLENGCG